MRFFLASRLSLSGMMRSTPSQAPMLVASCRLPCKRNWCPALSNRVTTRGWSYGGDWPFLLGEYHQVQHSNESTPCLMPLANISEVSWHCSCKWLAFFEAITQWNAVCLPSNDKYWRATRRRTDSQRPSRRRNGIRFLGINSSTRTAVSSAKATFWELSYKTRLAGSWAAEIPTSWLDLV